MGLLSDSQDSSAAPTLGPFYRNGEQILSDCQMDDFELLDPFKGIFLILRFNNSTQVVDLINETTVTTTPGSKIFFSLINCAIAWF